MGHVLNRFKTSEVRHFTINALILNQAFYHTLLAGISHRYTLYVAIGKLQIQITKYAI